MITNDKNTILKLKVSQADLAVLQAELTLEIAKIDRGLLQTNQPAALTLQRAKLVKTQAELALQLANLDVRLAEIDADMANHNNNLATLDVRLAEIVADMPNDNNNYDDGATIIKNLLIEPDLKKFIDKFSRHYSDNQDFGDTNTNTITDEVDRSEHVDIASSSVSSSSASSYGNYANILGISGKAGVDKLKAKVAAPFSKKVNHFNVTANTITDEFDRGEHVEIASSSSASSYGNYADIVGISGKIGSNEFSSKLLAQFKDYLSAGEPTSTVQIQFDASSLRQIIDITSNLIQEGKFTNAHDKAAAKMLLQDAVSLRAEFDEGTMFQHEFSPRINSLLQATVAGLSPEGMLVVASAMTAVHQPTIMSGAQAAVAMERQMPAASADDDNDRYVSQQRRV